MIRNERFPRKPEWTEGVWFRGADGSDYCLPVLDQEAYDRLPRVRELYEETDRRADEGIAPPGPAEVKASLCVLFSELIFANYHLNEFDAMAIVSDGERLDDRPFLAVVECLKNAPLAFAMFATADRRGLDRDEVVHLMTSTTGTEGEAVRGWHSHDGCLFDN